MARPGSKNNRSLRKDRTGASPVRVGLIAAVGVIIVCYFAFTKAIPFTHDFRLNAVFQSANSIRPQSPVRIAGVNVGKVTGVEREPGTNAAIVQMEIKDDGLPIHKDATLKIRPRIFLEGNFFVDLKPGTPAAPTLNDNDTVAITQTATPVQLDEVLTALQQPTREDLQTLLRSFGGALNDEPTAADDLTQDPSVRGKTAGQALNQSLDYSPAALKNSSIVNQAFLGESPNDLSDLIASLGTVAKALNRSESTLQDLVTNFNTTLAAFAGQSSNLSQAIAILPQTLTNADKAFVSLDSSFPSTRAFALELIPGTEQTQPTIDAALPWIAQAEPLVSKAELGGLLDNLQPTTANLAATTAASIPLFQQGNEFSLCQTKVFLPTGDIKISDGAFSSGAENYKEFWYSLVGLSGEGQSFDGNGQYVRFQTGGGPYKFTTGPFYNKSGLVNKANAAAPPKGSRPPYTRSLPPKVTTQPCYKQKIPDVNGAGVGRRDGGAAGVLPQSLSGGSSARSVPQTQAVATPLTSTPPTETATGSASSATARSTSGGSGSGSSSGDDAAPNVAGDLLSRLNPYRGIGETRP
jgi:phospholipid/cholesterol/gamma-HCH transport system substrate-binding protein